MTLKVTKLKYIDLAFLFSIVFLWLFFFYFMYKKNQASIVLAFYTIFLLVVVAEDLTFGALSHKSVLSYSSVLLVFSLISAALHQESYRLGKQSIATVLSMVLSVSIYIIPAAIVIYFMSFNAPVNQEALNAVFQTNTSEGMEFISDFVPFNVTLIFISLASFLIYIFYWHNSSKIVFVDRSMFGVLVILFLTILMLAPREAKLPNFIYSSLKKYNIELDAFKKVQDLRKADQNSIQASKAEQGETYVVVIGESLNKNHMQLYGYPRETTPNLVRLYEDK